MKRYKYHFAESGLSRIVQHIKEHDCAIMTAWRKQLIDCLLYDNKEDVGKQISKKENKERNKELLSVLLKLKYSITSVDGSYIEGYKDSSENEQAKESKEDSFFIVNINDEPDFIKKIIKLGKFYCQDSVFILPKNDTPYLFGTNKYTFPGLNTKVSKPKFTAGTEKEFMTKIRNRPFAYGEGFRHFNDCQNASKYLISIEAEPIIKILNEWMD